jgi:GLPGLI family protein
MKHLFIAAVAGLLAQSVAAQVKEGSIVYERKINMHKRLGPEQESMKNMIPEFNTSKTQLLFSETESVFKNVKEEEDIRETAGQEGGGRMVMRFGGGENETYKNYATEKLIELRELGPKKYIIEDSLRKLNWKLDESETKTIKGYTCKKATSKNPQGLNIEAWYTEQISCPSGPEIWGGLPGMILELNIGDGEIVFTPLEVADKSDKKMVKAPSNGKKISRKEFQKMMDDQFGPASPGGGPVIRVMRSN